MYLLHFIRRCIDRCGLWLAGSDGDTPVASSLSVKLVPYRIVQHLSNSGETFVIAYRRNEFPKLCRYLLSMQARPELNWTEMDSAALLRDLEQHDLCKSK